MNDKIPEFVIDTNNVRYQLDRILGSGGQGAVYSVAGKDLAIKLLETRKGSDSRRLSEEVARIRRLPLDGLNIAKPLRLLASPHHGYVMELMTGMVPMKSIAHLPREEGSNLTPWHIKTGSLSRRLRLLANVADIFKDLHARGMSYGDASSDNIFISEGKEDFEAWLIDCDNICQGVQPRSVYTPGYAAPELLNGHVGPDSLTDAWSLATIVFETLCMLHPFQGDLVHDGSPDLEEAAARGEIPWVDDKDDVSNSASRGLPRSLTLTTPLQKLASDCFGLSRIDRQSRPTAGIWAEKLHQAADQSLACPKCSGSYYLNRNNCPWCDALKPAFVLADVCLCDHSLSEGTTKKTDRLVRNPTKRPTVLARTVIQPGHWTIFTDRLLSGGDNKKSEVGVTLDGNGLEFIGYESSSYSLEHLEENKVLHLSGNRERMKLPAGKYLDWWLTPDEAKGVHRVVLFELHPGGKS